ncbi:hypothetical protein JOF56_002816 [Kibdelosporangium banguiense]|uniref:Nuclear transport factor 2 family protein n=1 Tax=Kibdelosporangium banguiense TaxID=1365924 RepID=A0ABS4TDK7_9PSEU|nr:hypothetical protein [Kibdelosporangium banguiense]MBP2322431.1 hypothetical protein [Kibdelosporangium banguiense]
MADNEQPSQSNQPVPYDPDQQRQFEQFQQFQQFLQFQEAQGQGQLPPAIAPKKRPGWQKFLLSKLFRRLVLLGLVIGAAAWGCSVLQDTFNIAPKDDGLGQQGGAGPGGEAQRMYNENPKAGVQTVYSFVARGNVDACRSFEPAAAKQFADDFGAADCPAAVKKLAGTVGSNPEVRDLNWSGVQTLTVSSCTQLRPKPGTRLLGEFTFSKHPNGWLVSAHKSEPDPCPAPTTTAPPTTSR